jgi:hypothetical protein
MIGLVKKCLEQTLAGRRCSLGELYTILAEAALMVNSRPIARSSNDPDSGGPITPLHLQLGRATLEAPRVKFAEGHSLVQRLKFVEEVKRQFWEKYMKLVFQGRVLAQQWRKEKRNVAVGDVVCLAEAETDDPTYRLGVVEYAKPGEDGKVRTVTIRYTNPSGATGERSPFKTTTRPIHKIAVMVPAGYKFEEDGRASVPEEIPRDEANEVEEDPRPALTWEEDMENEDEPGPPNPVEDEGAEGHRPENAEGHLPLLLNRAPRVAKRGRGRPRGTIARPIAAPSTQPEEPRQRRLAAIRAEENVRRGLNMGRRGRRGRQY